MCFERRGGRCDSEPRSNACYDTLFLSWPRAASLCPLYMLEIVTTCDNARASFAPSTLPVHRQDRDTAALVSAKRQTDRQTIVMPQFSLSGVYYTYFTEHTTHCHACHAGHTHTRMPDHAPSGTTQCLHPPSTAFRMTCACATLAPTLLPV